MFENKKITNNKYTNRISYSECWTHLNILLLKFVCELPSSYSNNFAACFSSRLARVEKLITDSKAGYVSCFCITLYFFALHHLLIPRWTQAVFSFARKTLVGEINHVSLLLCLPTVIFMLVVMEWYVLLNFITYFVQMKCKLFTDHLHTTWFCMDFLVSDIKLIYKCRTCTLSRGPSTATVEFL